MPQAPGVHPHSSLRLPCWRDRTELVFPGAAEGSAPFRRLRTALIAPFPWRERRREGCCHGPHRDPPPQTDRRLTEMSGLSLQRYLLAQLLAFRIRSRS